ncbi:MAG: ABC transporter permease [Bacteroidales bacterium]
MLDLEFWREIGLAIRKNKLRTFLTSFSVAWGIFMVTTLLGAGNGLKNAGEYSFKSSVANLLKINPYKTSKEYRGFKEGRWIKLNNSDIKEISQRINNVANLNPEVYVGGNLKYKNQSLGYLTTVGVSPTIKKLQKLDITEGRFLNYNDIHQFRKVAILGTKAVEQIFGKNEDPIGKIISINDVNFKIVGVFDGEFLDDQQREKIFLPFTLVQKVFRQNDEINKLSMTFEGGSVHQAKVVEKEIRELLSLLHKFDPNDNRALFIQNKSAEKENMSLAFRYLTYFIWFISFGSIICGMIGVSNIMVIIVKERTREFGIRKALGASPASVVNLIIMESIVITVIAGTAGLLMGVFAVDILKNSVENSMAFRNPYVDIWTAITALIVLIVAGAAAGFIPARRAARIRPIEALRAD